MDDTIFEGVGEHLVHPLCDVLPSWNPGSQHSTLTHLPRPLHWALAALVVESLATAESRTFCLEPEEDKMMSFQNHKGPTDRKTVSSCAKIPVDVFYEPKNIRKAIQDISAYFSDEEWGKLTKWQKSAYVYMKRNYDRMMGLGVTVNQPVFMRCKEQAKRPLVECVEIPDGEDESSDRACGMTQRKRIKLVSVTICIHDIREELTSGKHGFYLTESGTVYINPWKYRLRERKKRVRYAEISDPEEDDDDY
uniref:protein SSX4-like n=1 Tax=Arvicanthis niloticus TaxID=61156 RepID=UPI001486742C|nr:protein SSX4-like [Arvicanthis niloticus]